MSNVIEPSGQIAYICYIKGKTLFTMAIRIVCCLYRHIYCLLIIISNSMHVCSIRNAKMTKKYIGFLDMLHYNFNAIEDGWFKFDYEILISYLVVI